MSRKTRTSPPKKHPIQTKKAQRCVHWLILSLWLGLAYALILVFLISLNLAAPELHIPASIQSLNLVLWALAKIGFAFSLVCLYHATGYTKWAIAAMLLAASAVMPYILTNPASQVFVLGIEALAVTGLSLSLFDLGRATQRDLGAPAGFIFLGVILQILQSPIMAYVGILLLASGFYLSLKQLLHT